MKTQNVTVLRQALLAWYDEHGRQLPWRVRPEDRARGARADPYRVWLSEIMLQQTTVAAATPYYEMFLRRYPTVEALAAAPVEDVLAEWAGLGYYARARNLHACARRVAATGGAFPETEKGLLALPGIGAYTAAAIAAVVHDTPANVVDGNVERVIARMCAVDAPVPRAKPQLRRLAAPLVDPERPGDYAQALMDLGATVCTPKSPSCGSCPWSRWCMARERDPTQYPRRVANKPKPVRRGVAYAAFSGDQVLVRRRPAKGLLGGMVELPTSPWQAEIEPDDQAYAPFPAHWRDARQPVSHVFSHFSLELAVRWTDLACDAAPAAMWWADATAPDQVGFPSVMRKAFAAAWRARRGAHQPSDAVV